MKWGEEGTDRHVAEALIELGQFALKLGRVDRVTYHPDGRTPESDTDHTVMLGLIAPAFAARFLPDLDRGTIVQYVLVHDLVEVYAGDVNTLLADPAMLQTKKQREQVAADQIYDEFKDTLPWVPAWVYRYEDQDDAESRYVWIMDKIMPKITHVLNGGTTARDSHMSAEDMARRLALQTREIRDKAAGLEPVEELYAIMKGLLFEYVYGTTEAPA